jgi:hypothetical protein
MFFVESTSNRGSERPDRRIFEEKAGSAAVECKDVIENVRKWKKADILCVGMTALITLLTARALHFVDIRKSHLDTKIGELRQGAESAIIYMIFASTDHI